MGKLKFKQSFNAIDAIVIALLLILIVSVAYMFIKGDGFFVRVKTEIEYKITINNFRTEFIGNISKEDKIYDSDTSSLIGEITDLEFIKAEEGVSTVTVTVSANAEKKNDNFYVNGVLISKNTHIQFRTPRIIASGVCSEINIKGEK